MMAPESTRLPLTANTIRDDQQPVKQGPDLQNILRQSYDYLTIIQKLRSTYDGRLIYKTSYTNSKWTACYR